MAYSTGGQELLVGLASAEIGGRDGPRITSACHCSSRVCEPGELVFSACLAGACGFVMGDSVRVSGAATPGKCPHCSVRDWPSATTGSAPTLHRRGPCGCAANPARVFASPALDTRSGVLLLDRRRSSLQEAFPWYNHPRKRRECWQKGGGNHRRATDRTAENRLLQTFQLV